MKTAQSITGASDDVRICLENLSLLDERQAALFGSRCALIRELAYSICADGNSPDTIRENYSVAFPRPTQLSPSSQSYLDVTASVERAGVCIELAALLGKDNPFLRAVLGQGEVCHGKAVGKISYVKNNYTDSAYLFFSKLVREPKCSYSDSFETICEDVFNGGSEFCILPTETSSDGRLFSFYSLIDRYDLKTCAVFSVERNGGASFTKFALLRRSFSDIDITNVMHGDDAMLELRISHPVSPDASLNSIFRAADSCGMPLLRVDSLPLPYGDALLSHYAVFGVNRSALYGFLTFVALEFPQCYASGLYLSGNPHSTNNKLKGYIN